MRKIISILILFCGCQILSAQNNCQIPLMVFVPEQTTEIPIVAQQTLETRLRQIVTQNGMEGGARFANFCIVAHTSEGSKEVISGTRPLITLTIELELYIGNNYTGEKFASTSVILKGAGRNEAKAYSTAFASLNANNPEIQKYLKEAKNKINRYYETQLQNILTQANGYANRHEFEEALCLLTSVPSCCNGYDKVEQCMLNVFQSYIDFDCATKVNKARTVWMASQDKEGATLAGAYLAAIDPSSSCWDDALAVEEQIRKRMGDDWEFAKELQRDAVKLEQSRIDAIKAIGVAYGENQKAVTIRENWLVR